MKRGRGIVSGENGKLKRRRSCSVKILGSSTLLASGIR